MSKDTKIRLALAVMVFMMVQAVLFGFGMMTVLYNPNKIGEPDFFWIPVIIVASSIISAGVSWWIAPHLRARFWRSEGEHSFIKWQGEVAKAAIGDMSTRSTTRQNATLKRSLAA